MAVGDDISVNEWRLCHALPNRQPRQIGALKKPLQGDGNSKLKVSAVVRYQQMPDPANPNLFNQLAPTVQKQGWSYVVLVSGTL